MGGLDTAWLVFCERLDEAWGGLDIAWQLFRQRLDSLVSIFVFVLFNCSLRFSSRLLVIRYTAWRPRVELNCIRESIPFYITA